MVCLLSSLSSSISFGIDQDIFALLVFVALGDFLVLDRPHSRRDLLIADAFARRLMDLVEARWSVPRSSPGRA